MGPDADEPEDLLDDERRRVPLETYAGWTPSPLPAMAPDGGPEPGLIGNPPPVPAATPETFVCLRGPCRHYWEMTTHLVSGNPAETWGEDGLRDEGGQPLRAPRQISRVCTAQAGTETELTDDIVYGCNRWDPVVPVTNLMTRLRRRLYTALFPVPKE